MGRIRARRATRRRVAPRWDRDQWEGATQTLLARDHGRCPVCAQLITDRAERHHRQRRAVGGDRYANLVLLHSACHAWVTEHPELAHDNGLIVWTHEDPAQVPLRFYAASGPAWYLHDDGTRTRHPET